MTPHDTATVRLEELLGEHCAALGAEGAALLRVASDGRVEILGVHPPPQADTPPPDWLTRCLQLAGEAADGDDITARPLHDGDQLYDQPARRHLVLAALRDGAARCGLLAFAARGQDPAALVAAVKGLVVQLPALGLYGLHLDAGTPRRPAPPLQPAMAAVAAVNEHDRYQAAAMAFCNDLATRWQCQRVSLGFLRGPYVRLEAMSHTEKFLRGTAAVQLVEAAMEECLDQDAEVLWPSGAEANCVCRAAAELSAGAGQAAVLSLPLRHRRAVVGAATLERPADQPFSLEQAEQLRLACELCTPRLVDLRRSDRWLGAKAADALGRAGRAMVGARYTRLKLAAVAVAAAAVYGSLATGQYRIEAPFVLEASRQQVLPAPLAGEIESVSARVGDRVQAGQELARLKTLPLQRSLSSAQAELFENEKQADSARADKKWAEAQMAGAKVAQLREQIQLLREQIDKASVKALIAGTVVTGDLDRMVGSSVEKGQVLFEVAPIELLRAELAVPEDQVADLLAARKAGPVRGALSAASFPDRRIDFLVERIDPLGQQAEGKVVFKVRAHLAATQDWMRPGMAGLARVDLGPRKLAWIWSRRLVNWVRLWCWF
jgi:multidrug efflux pump subunit AcrA (membrane-fusion protein)